MRNKKSVIWLVLVLIVSFFITKYTEQEPSNVPLAEDELAVVFVDTGNSDSIVIHFPDERTMLIDAGKPDDFDVISDVLDSFSEDTIDYAVITHQHDDHIGSFPEILKYYNVERVYLPDSPISNPQTKESMALISEKNIPVIQAKAGVTVCDGEIKAEFLSPMYEHYGDKNDYSGVLYLTYGEKSFLFTGDATIDAENDMLSKGVVPQADVLKIGHHGSRSSTSKNFLNAVNPKYAVITTGENDYGHPHKQVTDRLGAMSNKTGLAIYRSDHHGNVLFVTDGKELTVTSERE